MYSLFVLEVLRAGKIKISARDQCHSEQVHGPREVKCIARIIITKWLRSWLETGCQEKQAWKRRIPEGRR